MSRQRATLAFETADGTLRAFMSLQRSQEGSVYLFPKTRDRGYLDWDRLPHAERITSPDLHVSVHLSGWVNVRTREPLEGGGTGPPRDLARFKMPELATLDAPTYVLQILPPPRLDAYPAVQPGEDVFPFHVAQIPGPISSVAIAVGPSMRGKVAEGKRRVPIPTLPNGARFYGVLTVEIGDFYFAAAPIGPAEDFTPPDPPEAETWAPIRSDNPDDFRPRPAP